MVGVIPGHPFRQMEPAAGQIAQIKQPNYPQLRFEWHPQKQVCYVIRVGVLTDGKEMAEPFAWEIQNSGQAINATQIWLRGYQHGKLELRTGSVSEHKEKSNYVELG